MLWFSRAGYASWGLSVSSVFYTKYESSGSCRFRQEDFWKLHLKNYVLTPWPTYATDQNLLNNLVEDYPETIPVEFGQIPISGSR